MGPDLFNFFFYPYERLYGQAGYLTYLGSPTSMQTGR